MLFARQFSSEGRTRRFCVERGLKTGWAAREEADDRLVMAVHYDDWHRVERVLALFERESSILKEEGWMEDS